MVMVKVGQARTPEETIVAGGVTLYTADREKPQFANRHRAWWRNATQARVIGSTAAAAPGRNVGRRGS
jgi:hypothetical protein